MAFGNREPIDKVTRDECFHKFGGHCAYCGYQLKSKGWHVDHVIPVAKGGVDDIVNFFPACKHCNLLKSDSTLEGFRDYLEGRTLKSAFIVAERFEMITIKGPVKIVFWFEKQGYKFPEDLVNILIKNQRRPVSD